MSKTSLSWRPWGDHPIIVAILVLTAIISTVAILPSFFSKTEQIQYFGRVINIETQKPIDNAKVFLDFGDAPPIVFTDSEGIFNFKVNLVQEQLVGRVRVEAEGYDRYSRTITLSKSINQIEDIRLASISVQPTSVPSPIPSPVPTQQAMQINDRDFDRASNPFYGFRVSYPKAWDRADPDNGDGNTYQNPKDRRIYFIAYGGTNVVFDYQTVKEYVSGTIDNYQKTLVNFQLLENVERGLYSVEWLKEEKDFIRTQKQVEGTRLKYKYIEDGVEYTVQEVLALNQGRTFSAECRAPSDVYLQYEDLCLYLLGNIEVFPPGINR